LEITNAEDWQIKHLNFIQNSYKKHPHYKEIMDQVEFLFHKDYERLVDIVIDSMNISMKIFGIETKTLLQSDMDYDRETKKGDLVMELIKAAGADCYLSGTGAQAYLDETQFGHGIELKYNVFKHPVYPQKNSTEFIPGLACLDILFNLGSAGARNLLLNK
jgi:hypothetical protein